MLSENAKDIEGYEGLYAITNDGRVYSIQSKFEGTSY
ncbi:NUMOD4 domain-containing protein [Escherichia coli]|nr:NUMOD4 domain-containing protein [Escherichia coli]MDM4894084.1 NUMOD4 domain-containing protein [Escherichia coli]